MTRNRRDVWVYPTDVDASAPAGVTVATELDDAARDRLRDGETVALFADPGTVETGVELGFTPVFWNTAWTAKQAPHTLGLRPDPDHPALEAFSTDGHADWQWWDPIANGAPMELDDLPRALRPIVEVVPDWFDPQPLGLVFEVAMFEGALLVCSIDLTSDLGSRPVARQLRSSLLRYAASDRTDPDVTVSPERVSDLFE